jgi:hypothetical protein
VHAAPQIYGQKSAEHVLSSKKKVVRKLPVLVEGSAIHASDGVPDAASKRLKRGGDSRSQLP